MMIEALKTLFALQEPPRFGADLASFQNSSQGASTLRYIARKSELAMPT